MKNRIIITLVIVVLLIISFMTVNCAKPAPSEEGTQVSPTPDKTVEVIEWTSAVGSPRDTNLHIEFFFNNTEYLLCQMESFFRT